MYRLEPQDPANCTALYNSPLYSNLLLPSNPLYTESIHSHYAVNARLYPACIFNHALQMKFRRLKMTVHRNANSQFEVVDIQHGLGQQESKMG
ncbi:uncharacterized protein N7483_011399 [Penicillium malachiteum]|uniref:uncharacterized protein n=1 Tax=Penicillium malachiteum TaxID=1324776 RepID=UPI00254838C0|nr:uncharacterized protein N7483_011399 [Penicillium malachiteum]KAJ5714218.1 hypothetical protein N7483_011399 [Penicillium malachiteum]